MNRRTFIKIAATTTAAFVSSACQRAPESTSTQSPTSTIASITKPAQTLVTIPGTEVRSLVSKTNNQEYRIFVAVPKMQNTKRLPVIYLTDGNGNFGLVDTICDQLVGDNYIPPSILVGIGYPFDEYDEYKDLRGRDFTPTALPDNSPYKNEFRAGAGGASKFLQFLREELKPLIDSQYPTLPNDSTVIGHSLGGLFTLYALFREPTLFQRYVIGSPSIWWDNKSIMNEVNSFPKTHTDLPARVFMGAGKNEQYMIEPMVDLADKLADYKYPGLTLKRQIFESETHLSVIPLFISQGLRAVYG